MIQAKCTNVREGQTSDHPTEKYVA